MEKIVQTYCSTGEAMTVKDIAAETGFKPQNINRIVNSMGKSGLITIIGCGVKRQAKYLLPADVLMAPSIFRHKIKNVKQNAELYPEHIVLFALGRYLRMFYARRMSMVDLDAFFLLMEKEPSPMWKIGR